MTHSLAVAVAGLLRENAGDFLRDGIRFADIRRLELSGVQCLRKRRCILDALEVDGNLVQIGPD
jgi:hypothetical protein